MRKPLHQFHVLMLGTVILSAAVLFADAARSQNLYYHYSARIRMPECRSFLAQNVGNYVFASGQCASLVSELIVTSRIICMPKEATLGDAVRIIINYFDARPARTPEIR
jgi:hypothetical protein